MALLMKNKPKTESQSLPAKANPNGLLTETEAADFLAITKAMLQRDRWLANRSGTSPVYPFYKLTGGIRYKKADLLAVLENSRVG